MTTSSARSDRRCGETSSRTFGLVWLRIRSPATQRQVGGRTGWSNVRWSLSAAKRVGLSARENHRAQSRDLYGMTEGEKDRLRQVSVLGDNCGISEKLD